MLSTKSIKKQAHLIKLAQDLATQPRQAANNLPLLVKSLTNSDIDVSFISSMIGARA
jgi:hypothetical protein